jgi:hypothetical protein
MFLISVLQYPYNNFQFNCLESSISISIKILHLFHNPSIQVLQF